MFFDLVDADFEDNYSHLLDCIQLNQCDLDQYCLMILC